MEKLFEAFEKSNMQEWIEEALSTLKGQDLAVLDSQTYEGITIRPFYTSQDIKGFENNFYSDHDKNTRQNRQEIIVKDQNEANQRALFALQNGIDSISFDLTRLTKPDLKSLFHKINLEKYSIEIKPGSNIEEIIPQIEKNTFQLSINYDFLADWTMTGSLPDNALDNLARLFKLNSAGENTKILKISGQEFYNSGGNAIQELAFSLSKLVEYADQLTNKGIAIDNLFSRVEFSMAIGSNYFMEIAKFRALRLLWRQILTAFKAKEVACIILARTAIWNKTTSDAYNNMLRATTEAMSAIIGGCNSLTIQPHNAHFEENDEFSERIARNISTILKEESHLDKTSDAASGAYFIDNLTVNLAENAWTLFQETEKKGGFVKAFEQNFIQDEIEKIASEKLKNLKDGKDILVGVNKFQNKTEIQDTPEKGLEINTKTVKFQLLKPFRMEKGLKNQ